MLRGYVQRACVEHAPFIPFNGWNHGGGSLTVQRQKGVPVWYPLGQTVPEEPLVGSTEFRALWKEPPVSMNHALRGQDVTLESYEGGV